MLNVWHKFVKMDPEDSWNLYNKIKNASLVPVDTTRFRKKRSKFWRIMKQP